ncbi:MAG: DUF559 domain-containing protein [Roseiarcus sp.]|jgi:very-short-patch-repair endonuclease
MRKARQDPIFDPADASTELPRAKAAEFILGMVEGSILALGGIDGEGLRVILDAVEPDRCGRRALFAWIAPAPTAEAIVEQALNLLAETARRLWPLWFTDVSFAGCRDDRLGRLAVGAIARSAAKEIAGLSPSWAAAAARLAMANRPPRVKGTLPAVELAQLTRAISRSGLVLVADVSVACEGPNPAAMVRALEWIAQHSRGAVVALFAELPPNEPPFDRILYGARRVTAADGVESGTVEPDAAGIADAALWIAPWRGLPHPLSDIEQRLAKALSADAELAPLFAFNRVIDTIRDSRPKVDLVWREGRLVVELDGYGSHGNRTAFIYDRHRDYELTLSGYTVLRLTNDEIAQDCEKAVEKIRDLVRLRRTQTASEV